MFLRAASASSTLRTTYNTLKITLIIKALNYAKPSPAQPSPSPSPAPSCPGKKCTIFSFFIRQRYSRTVKSCCSKIEKIKLFSDQRYLTERIKNACFGFLFFSIKIYVFLQRHSREFKYPRRHFALGSISFSMKINDF